MGSVELLDNEKHHSNTLFKQYKKSLSSDFYKRGNAVIASFIYFYELR